LSSIFVDNPDLGDTDHLVNAQVSADGFVPRCWFSDSAGDETRRGRDSRCGRIARGSMTGNDTGVGRQAFEPFASERGAGISVPIFQHY
jgi:hypothetical protein